MLALLWLSAFDRHGNLGGRGRAGKQKGIKGGWWESRSVSSFVCESRPARWVPCGAASGRLQALRELNKVVLAEISIGRSWGRSPCCCGSQRGKQEVGTRLKGPVLGNSPPLLALAISTLPSQSGHRKVESTPQLESAPRDILKRLLHLIKFPPLVREPASPIWNSPSLYHERQMNPVGFADLRVSTKLPSSATAQGSRGQGGKESVWPCASKKPRRVTDLNFL